jgi:hypothetical protein
MQQRAPIVACIASEPKVAPPRFNPQSFCWQDASEFWSALQESDNLVKCNDLMPSVDKPEKQTLVARRLLSVVVTP